MSQFDFGNIDPVTKSGTQLANDLNNHRDAIQSSHKGSAQPAYRKVGMFWLDDAANPIWILKMWDGTDWIQILQVDVSNNLSTADFDRVAQTLGPAISVNAAGTANTYTGSISPAPPSYVTSMFIFVTWNVTNTGASTFNLNGLGARSIKHLNGANVGAGDLPINGTSLLYYNGTDFITIGAQSGVKVSSNDSTAGFLNGKLVAGNGITLTEQNDGANETLRISASGGCQLIGEFDLSGQSVVVIPVDGAAYKAVRLEFENCDCGGIIYFRVFRDGVMYDGSQYYNRTWSITGATGGQLDGAYNSVIAQGEFVINGLFSDDYYQGEMWISSLNGKYTSFIGTFVDANRVPWEFRGVVNLATPAAVTDIQIGRAGGSTYASGSIVRAYGYF